MKRAIGAVCAVIFLSSFALWAQDPIQHSELSVQVTGVFTSNTNVKNLTSATAIKNQIATNSAGVLIGYRIHLTPWEALEVEYGYTQNGQRYYTPATAPGTGPATYAISSTMNDLDANEVVTTPRLFGFFQPFLLAGGGVVMFSPRGSSLPGAQRQTEGMFDYGAGLDFHIVNIGARLEFRELNFKAPYFGLPFLATNKWTRVASPSVGLIFTF
ncbi:MAG: hypothetical protein ACRD17_00295 [Terriglobales bacterium]